MSNFLFADELTSLQSPAKEGRRAWGSPPGPNERAGKQSVKRTKLINPKAINDAPDLCPVT